MICLNQNPSVSENCSPSISDDLDPPSSRVDRWPIAILGVPFDALTLDEAVERIARMVNARLPCYVVTPNVDFLVRSRQDADLRRILLEADLVLCDGMPLVWASRWLGNRLPERVAGADLTPHLLAQAECEGHSIYLLGASFESNEGAVAHIESAYPNLKIAGHYSPPFRRLEDMDNEAIIHRVRATKPDIVLVSLGCPKQEKWIAAHYRSMGAPVCIGVGATIDFLAGRMQRAPVWMQKCGLECVFRALQEPRRLLGRYARDFFYFGPAILKQCWRLRCGSQRSRKSACVSITTDSQVPRCFLSVTGRLDRSSIESSEEVWKTLRDEEIDCVVDLSLIEYIDCTGAALLWELRKKRIKAGHGLSLLPPAQNVVAALVAMGVMQTLLAPHITSAIDLTE